MSTVYDLGMASLLGLGTTSSSLVGAALGLYVRFSRRVLAGPTNVARLGWIARWAACTISPPLFFVGLLLFRHSPRNAAASRT
jgi:hypothetical protein